MDQSSKEKKLTEMYSIVREELTYRRSRQQQILTWSSAILVTINAAMLVSSSNALVLSTQGKLLAIVLVSIISLFSAFWQMKQRKLLSNLQTVVSKIMKELGYFGINQSSKSESVLPKSWESWGQNFNTWESQITHPTKILVTLLLGIAATFSILIK